MTTRNEAVKGKADKHCALLLAVATTKAAISKHPKNLNSLTPLYLNVQHDGSTALKGVV
jgi:hypothetical protein